MAATSSSSTTTRTRRGKAAAAATSARRSAGRAIALVAAIVALILIVGIVLVLLRANQSNELVSAVRDAASFLAGPFEGMFDLEKRRTETAVNWGVAAAVWFTLGTVIARVVGR